MSEPAESELVKDINLLVAYCKPAAEMQIHEAAIRIEAAMTASADLGLPVEIQIRGLLRALRSILGTPEGCSVLAQAAIIARRAKDKEISYE